MGWCQRTLLSELSCAGSWPGSPLGRPRGGLRATLQLTCGQPRDNTAERQELWAESLETRGPVPALPLNSPSGARRHLACLYPLVLHLA